MKKPLIIATRAGRLALAQTDIVVEHVKRKFPKLDIQIKTISAKGDIDRKTSLRRLQSTGFFTSELEKSLLEKQADIAVHSFKDLPVEQYEDLEIAAVCDRRFVEDCMIALKPVSSFEQMPKDSRIGTSSLRRQVQIKKIHPSVRCVDIRGNVPTRIKKLYDGQYDAVVLARAGIERLKLPDTYLVFDPEIFLPAAAQGAIAVQVRSSDGQIKDIVAAIDDERSRITASAERRILSELHCGCHAPVGVLAVIKNMSISISAFVSDLNAKRFIRKRIHGEVSQCMALADRLAHDLLKAGGEDILKSLKGNNNPNPTA